MPECLAVTWDLHFWQNDRDLVRTTAVTLGMEWGGGRGGVATDTEMSQHKNIILAKNILPPLLPGLEPTTFQSRVRRSNH